jgi:hypothetical protein
MARNRSISIFLTFFTFAAAFFNIGGSSDPALAWQGRRLYFRCTIPNTTEFGHALGGVSAVDLLYDEDVGTWGMVYQSETGLGYRWVGYGSSEPGEPHRVQTPDSKQVFYLRNYANRNVKNDVFGVPDIPTKNYKLEVLGDYVEIYAMEFSKSSEPKIEVTIEDTLDSSASPFDCTNLSKSSALEKQYANIAIPDFNTDFNKPSAGYAFFAIVIIGLGGILAIIWARSKTPIGPAFISNDRRQTAVFLRGRAISAIRAIRDRRMDLGHIRDLADAAIFGFADAALTLGRLSVAAKTKGRQSYVEGLAWLSFSRQLGLAAKFDVDAREQVEALKAQMAPEEVEASEMIKSQLAERSASVRSAHDRRKRSRKCELLRRRRL